MKRLRSVDNFETFEDVPYKVPKTKDDEDEWLVILINLINSL